MRATHPSFWCVRLPTLLLVVAIAAGSAVARADSKLRIAVLKFGTVSWVLDVIEHHELDETFGVDIDTLDRKSVV